VSPEISPARQEITETRPAFARRALPWLVLGVGLAGLTVGALVAAIVVMRVGPEATTPPTARVSSTSHDAGLLPREDAASAVALDASTDDAYAEDADTNDAQAHDAQADDAQADDAQADDAQADDAATRVAITSEDGGASEVTSPRQRTDEPRAPREGRIEVIVVPWGRVVIDGTDVGRSPYRGTLTTGPHRVEGVAGEERRARTVRVTGRGVTRVQIAIE
jgi:hypothetical protein